MKKLFLIIGIAFLANSCVKKEIELTTLETEAFDPSFAIPFGNIKLELGRVEKELSNPFLQINPTTNIMEFIVSDQEVMNYGMDELFTVANPTFTNSVGMPAGTVTSFNALALGATTNVNSNSTSTITAVNGEMIDSVILRKGKLNVGISSTFTHNASIILTIPSFKKNGISLSKTYTINYVSSTPVTLNLVESLDGYDIDLTDGGSTNNTVRFGYNITFTKGVGTATGSDQINFTLGLDMDTVERVKGYFGNPSLNVKGSNYFTVFQASFSGGISFADPRLEIKTHNMTGIPIDFSFDSINMPNNATNKYMRGSYISNNLAITKATNIGDTTHSDYVINNSNSSPQVKLFMEEKPDVIDYSVDLQINPAGVTPNFLTRESRIWANAKVILPLDAHVTGFTLNDTNNTKIKDLIGIGAADADNVKNILLRIIADNSLPIETKLQAYFTDSNNVIIDSLFDAGSEDLLPAATINFSVPTSHIDYGKVTSPTRNIIDISISNTKYKKLVDNHQSKIIYKATTGTVGAGTSKYVKFTPDNYVNLKIGAKIDLNVVIK